MERRIRRGGKEKGGVITTKKGGDFPTKKGGNEKRREDLSFEEKKARGR